MNIATKNMNKMNIDIVITIVPEHIKVVEIKVRGVQRLYRTTLLTMSRIQAMPACLPLDQA
jgi:hypothetical protein